MDTTTLTEALRALVPETLIWKFGLYGLNKGRDGLELEWNLCKFRGLQSYAENMRDALLNKPVAEKPVAPYSPFLSDKENIGAVERSDELMRERIGDILLNIKKGKTYPPEDYISGDLPKTVGFALYGERLGGDGELLEQVIFMRRSNPFLSGANASLCISDGKEIVPCDKPVLKFTATADFLLIGGVCYFFSSAVEKDFALENRHFARADRCMKRIAAADIVSDYDRLEKAAMTSKNARKFSDFDGQIMEHITRLPIVEREEFLTTYGVTIDRDGRMDTSDAEQCELIIDLLCCRSFLDPLGRLSTGSNITPRE